MIRDIGLLIWPKMTLSDLAIEVRESYQPSANEALPYVGLEHIEQDSLQLSAIGTSTDTRSTKRRFRKGDVLFGTLRPYFRKVVKARFDGVCSTDIRVLRARNPSDSDYLLYFIADRPFIDFATATSNGTRMPRANWELLSQCKWRIPPACSRRKIAAILSAYDDLIENNRRRIEILEEMAQALYREWFVEFRFPGHEAVRMVDSPLGEIPEGWEITTLGEVCDITMGSSPKSQYYNENGDGLPFHQGVSSYGDLFPTHTRYCTKLMRLAEAGDILFSVRAPVGRMNVADRRLVIGRGLASIRSKTGYQMFCLYQLKDRFREEDSMGGGTIFKAVTKQDMNTIPFIWPSDGCRDAFENAVHPMFEQMANLTRRNALLRQTRDLLLPRLISGELDVSELYIDVGEEGA